MRDGAIRKAVGESETVALTHIDSLPVGCRPELDATVVGAWANHRPPEDPSGGRVEFPVLPALLAHTDHEPPVRGEETRARAEVVVKASLRKRRIGTLLVVVGVEAANPGRPLDHTGRRVESHNRV